MIGPVIKGHRGGHAGHKNRIEEKTMESHHKGHEGYFLGVVDA
jgi:hypothetical protein